ESIGPVFRPVFAGNDEAGERRRGPHGTTPEVFIPPVAAWPDEPVSGGRTTCANERWRRASAGGGRRPAAGVGGLVRTSRRQWTVAAGERSPFAAALSASVLVGSGSTDCKVGIGPG